LPQWLPDFHRIFFLEVDGGKIRKMKWRFDGVNPEGDELVKAT